MSTEELAIADQSFYDRTHFLLASEASKGGSRLLNPMDYYMDICQYDATYYLIILDAVGLDSGVGD